MARDKQDTNDKLDKLRQKMQDTDTGGGLGTDFWKPTAGRNVIRVLPPVGDMEWFFQEVGRHYNLPGDENVICPEFTTQGEEDCPICGLVAELRNGSQADKALAGELRLRKQYWMNVIVRDPKDKAGDTGEGPFVYTPGIMVFKSMQAMILDPDYGDISDEEDGIDVTVDRSGEGMDTEYEVNARRHDSPLHVDPEQIDAWLDEAIDLSYVMLSDDEAEDDKVGEGKMVRVLPYARIAEYGLEPGANVDSLLKEAEEPVKASSKRRSTASKEDADDEVGAARRGRKRRR